MLFGLCLVLFIYLGCYFRSLWNLFAYLYYLLLFCVWILRVSCFDCAAWLTSVDWIWFCIVTAGLMQLMVCFDCFAVGNLLIIDWWFYLRLWIFGSALGFRFVVWSFYWFVVLCLFVFISRFETGLFIVLWFCAVVCCIANCVVWITLCLLSFA